MPCIQYAYDSAGNLTQRSDLGSYAYPAIAAGGRALRHAPASVVTPAGALPLEYDAEGRTTRWGTQHFAYDDHSRLRSSTAHGLTTSYTYLADGARATSHNLLRRTVHAGPLFSEVETTPSTIATLQRPYVSRQRVATYVIASDEGPVAEITHAVEPVQWMSAHRTSWPWVDTSGQQRSLVPAAYDGAAARSWEHTRAVYYLHRDPLGSVDMVTDRSGFVVERRSYAPFGSPRSPDWATGAAAVAMSDRGVGFTGHRDDPHTGLVDMGGRVHHPTLGRFLTPDPYIQAPDQPSSLSRYAYVWNNPLRWVDPTGFQAEPAATGGPPHHVFDDTRVTAERPAAPAVSKPAETPRASTSWTDLGAPAAPTVPGSVGLAPRYIDVYALDVSAPPRRVVVPEDHPTIAVHHPSFLEEYLEPFFPWVVLLDEHRLVPEGRRHHLVMRMVGDVATSWNPARRAPMLATVAGSAAGKAAGAVRVVAAAAAATAGTARHHAWPKYLGGAAKQELVTLPRTLHESFHSGLDKILPRQWGTEYYQRLSRAAKEQVLRDLADYTRAFDAKHGTSIFDALVKAGFPAP